MKSIERKWLISFECEEDIERYWSQIHEDGYDEEVFSVTQDQGFLDSIGALIGTNKKKKILIPGCGSNVYLQKYLLKTFGEEIDRIVCTDFERVVRIAEKKLEHPKVEFKAANTRDLAFSESFDLALVVNCIVSHRDIENREMLCSIAEALKPGGVLVGVFPTVMVDIEMVSLGHDNQPAVDFSKSLIFETKQKEWQIAYCPLRLRRILKEAGLGTRKVELLFLDSEAFKNYAREYYKILDDDIVLYEFAVVAEKS